MRALAGNAVAAFMAYQEAGLTSAAYQHHGLPAGVLLLFFCMLANSVFKVWWRGY